MKKRLFVSFKDWNFKKKLISIISAVTIIIVILISSFNFFFYSRNYTKQTVDQTQQIIEQVRINVDSYLDELLRLNLSPYYNDDIMGLLEDEYITKSSDLNQRRTIENFLASVMTLPRREILRVYILTDNNLYSYIRTPYDMNDYDNYMDTNWYLLAKESTSPVFLPIHSEKVFGDKKTQIFSIAKRIRSKEDNSKVLAVIKVDANYAGIKSICDQVQLSDTGSLFIIDNNQNVVYQNNKLNRKDILSQIPLTDYEGEGDFTETINNEKYIVNIASVKTTDLQVIAINSLSDLNKESIVIRNTTMILALFGTLFAVLFLLVFVQNFFKPLFSIINSMKQVQHGDLNVQVEVKNQDEIGYLARSFNKMIRRIKVTLEKNTQLVKEVYESKYLQKEAQYNNLCAQIKPHFLYNTLNTISLLIKCKNNDGAIDSIEKLSYFLRGIMNSDKSITLKAELEIVDSYLGILKARYNDNLTYQINVSHKYLDYQIPALTLQPLVENSIIHGCEIKRGKSEINIYSSQDEDYLYIHLIDNGIGIEKEKLDMMNTELALSVSLDETPREISEITESIGLINVNKRIKLIFGDSYGITLYSNMSKGTHVQLRLPLD